MQIKFYHSASSHNPPGAADEIPTQRESGGNDVPDRSLLRFMTKKLLLDAVILLALAILGVAGYKLAPLLDAKTDVALPLSTCNLNRQACTATLPDGSQLEFSIEPRPIPPLRPLQLRATIRGGKARGIEVDFAGTDMKMGFNRPALTGGDGVFTGQGTLPVCITGTMEWDATVLVDNGSTRIAVPFRFAVASE